MVTFNHTYGALEPHHTHARMHACTLDEDRMRKTGGYFHPYIFAVILLNLFVPLNFLGRALLLPRLPRTPEFCTGHRANRCSVH